MRPRRTAPHRQRRAPALVLLLTTLVAALLALGTAAPATAAPSTPAPQTFGIQPASATGPDSRSTYTYSAGAGAQIKDHVEVWNYGDQTLQLTLYAADAFNTDTGGYDVLPAGKTSKDVGSWVHLAVATVQLPARSRKTVPFTLAVPVSATPGDHSGGIVLSLRRITKDAKGNEVAVDERVGTRIHLRVPGALKPQLTLEGVSTAYHGTFNPFGTGSTTTCYTVRNTGNIRLAGHQAVRVRNAVGGIVTAKGPADLTELLPGNTATYTVTVPGILPTLWSTASITIDPLAVPGDTDPQLPSATTQAGFATVPWTLLGLLLLAGLVGYNRFRRYRRNRRGPTAPAPSTTPEPTPAPAGSAAGKTAAATTALLLVVGLALFGSGGSRAWADPSGTASAQAGSTAPGTLAFDYPSGHDDDPIDTLTSGACPHATDQLMASIKGAGFPVGGSSLLGLTPVSIFPKVDNGGYVVPLPQTLRETASQTGVTLRGTYTVDVYCRTRFNPAHLRDFSGTLDFTAPKVWKAADVAPAGSIHAAVKAAATALPTPSATSTVVAEPAAAPTARSAGTPVGSVVALVGGGVLLAGLGGGALRRQRARARAAGR